MFGYAYIRSHFRECGSSVSWLGYNSKTLIEDLSELGRKAENLRG